MTNYGVCRHILILRGSLNLSDDCALLPPHQLMLSYSQHALLNGLCNGSASVLSWLGFFSFGRRVYCNGVVKERFRFLHPEPISLTHMHILYNTMLDL